MCSINHDLKAIYIHLPKNGGLYIEKLLEEFYGFKNLYFTHENHNEFSDLDIEDIEPKNNGFINFKKQGLIKYHMSSEKFNNALELTNEKWNSYFKFTFIRNPYDKIVSAYKYINSNNYGNKKVTFQQFIDNKDICSDYTYFHAFITQYKQLLNLDNEININYLGKFENLNVELINILKMIGIKKILHYGIIEKNVSINRSNVDKNYALYYNDEILQKVNNIFNEDFLYFKYKKNETIEELISDSEIYYISNEKLKINNDNIISTILLHLETNTIEDETTNLLENENENIKKQLLLTKIQDNQKKRDQVIKHYEYIVKNIGGIISSIIKNSL
jgi:hypothetical protein